MRRCLQYAEAKRTGNIPAITDDVVGRSLKRVYISQWSLVLPDLNIFPINKTWAHGISAIHLGNLWLCQLQLTWYEIQNEGNEKLFLEQTAGISGRQLFSYNYTKHNKSQRLTQDSIQWVCETKRQFCQLQFLTAALKTSSYPVSSLSIRPIYHQKCAIRFFYKNLKSTWIYNTTNNKNHGTN